MGYLYLKIKEKHASEVPSYDFNSSIRLLLLIDYSITTFNRLFNLSKSCNIVDVKLNLTRGFGHEPFIFFCNSIIHMDIWKSMFG